MSKSRLWTLAMALAASMGRPGSAQARQLESEIQALVQESESASRESFPRGEGAPHPAPGARNVHEYPRHNP